MWIQTIRINFFLVFLSLYIDRSLLDNTSWTPVSEEAEGDWESNEEQKSEHSSDQSDCYSSIVFPKQK